jgi:predicted regulator of Ras-like GTPase activity (Roadblock/LC7/MglB family)
MNNEAYSMALRNALIEIKNICPDIQASFLFDNDGTVIVGDTESPEAPYEKTVNAMESLLNKTETIGGLDSLTINAQRGRVHISRVNDMYLAMVTAKNVDMTYLQTVSRVLIPTVIKLLDNITTAPAPIKLPSSRPSSVHMPIRIERGEKVEETSDEETNEETVEKETEKPERLTLSPTRTSRYDLREPSYQLVVDTLGGLLVRGDTVQIDAEILKEWSNHHDGAEINQVEIISFNGKSVVCKVKPIKGSKIEGKDAVKIPEKTRKDLDVKKGEMVRVKPIMEEE